MRHFVPSESLERSKLRSGVDRIRQLEHPQSLTLAPSSSPMSDSGSVILTTRLHNGLERCVAAFLFISTTLGLIEVPRRSRQIRLVPIT